MAEGSNEIKATSQILQRGIMMNHQSPRGKKEIPATPLKHVKMKLFMYILQKNEKEHTSP